MIFREYRNKHSIFSILLILNTVSTCQEHLSPVPPLILKLEGLKLGQRALYSCPVGYSIDGISNSTCLASGKFNIINRI